MNCLFWSQSNYIYITSASYISSSSRFVLPNFLGQSASEYPIQMSSRVLLVSNNMILNIQNSQLFIYVVIAEPLPMYATFNRLQESYLQYMCPLTCFSLEPKFQNCTISSTQLSFYEIWFESPKLFSLTTFDGLLCILTETWTTYQHHDIRHNWCCNQVIRNMTPCLDSYYLINI